MRITSLRMENIKCFSDEKIEFSDNINVIIGPNNSGKSTILNCLMSLQKNNPLLKRINTMQSSYEIGLKETNLYFKNDIDIIKINNNGVSNMTAMKDGQFKDHPQQISNKDPSNFLIPFQSNRKVTSYSEDVKRSKLEEVTGNFSNLYAKIDRISNTEYQPANSEYIEACDNILGFRITTSSSTNGKRGVYVIHNDINIPISEMGEGIINIIGLIVELCRTEDKLFLIEEPENDIHPKALIKLLDLISKKSKKNQFIITTHSNIVVKYLISIKNSKLFNIEMEYIKKIPTSKIKEILTFEERLNALENLGYSLFDYNLWDYWFFFEESSAERIFRDYFIRWFLNNNKKIRTFSARCKDELKIKFDSFNQLFVFLYLEQVYKNKVWVFIDNGYDENIIIEKMKSTYKSSGWNEENFIQLGKHDFEEYYPIRFQKKVKTVLAIEEKKRKKEEKTRLLEEVICWINEDEDNAKEEFKHSAREIIAILEKINLVIN